VTQAPDPPAADPLVARYGRPSQQRRRVGLVVVSIATLALLAWAIWAAIGQSDGAVGGLVESYDVRSPHAVSVTVQITRGSGDPVECTVSAIAEDHSEVGRRMVRLPAGDSGTHTVTTLVRTEREATAADVTDCH
jgi:hypothetical protein